MLPSATKINKDIVIGAKAIIQDFCVIGIDGEKTKIKTVIGKNALIRSHTVIYAGVIIGDNFRTGHGVLIRELTNIGNNVSIGSHSIVEHHVRIEDFVRIHSNVFVPEFTVLGKKCWIGPGVIFTNAKYPGAKRTKEFLQGTIVGENSKIGAGSVILPGVTIGRNSLIGAGSVVTKNVPDDTVVFGNPAVGNKNIKRLRFDDGSIVY